MLFNSFEYLLFLPIVFLLYWYVAKDFRKQNVLIVLASYTFYGWWDLRFLFLIALTTFLSYLSGRLMARYEGLRQRQRLVSAVNIVVNLGLLGFFKYYNFFADSLVSLAAGLGFRLDAVTLDILLPVGISFYTFQALSYSIDVYRRQLTASRNLVSFMAYISFFPQLVAGPIERATNLLPQFERSRRFNYDHAVDGCRRILWGLFKKMVVADNCAMAVNTIWADYAQADGFVLLVGAVLFSFQIYGDFSGYSDIAIGTARLFGIELMQNFRTPYFSRDIAEFWRRWHISLNTWFRDYLYIPLGGSRCSIPFVLRNTFVIFVVSGLWHGANWTFVVWGFFHALLFVPLLLFGKNRKHLGPVADGRFVPGWAELVQMSGTFALVTLGWIIFRAESIGQAADYVARLCSPSLFRPALPQGKQALVFVALLIAVEWVQRNREHALCFGANGLPRPLRWVAYVGLALLIGFCAGEQAAFIYFQF